MTLTEVSYYSRRLLPFAIIGILVLLIFFYAGKVFLLYLDTVRPKQYSVDPKLWTKYGMIKPPEIAHATPSGSIEYIFDTVEGEPVTATETAKVIAIPPTTTKFGFREKIYLMANKLKFNTEVTKYDLTGTEATFNEENQKLSVDVTNFNFTYEYDVKKDPSVFANTNIPQAKYAEDQAKSFLRDIGRYPEELAKGKTNTTYHLFDPETKELRAVERPQDANVVEVDFYRPDIDLSPLSVGTVPPKYFNSQNYVIMVFNEEGFKIIKAQVRFYETSEVEYAVYPLKTGKEAYQELLDGKGTLVALPHNSRTATIKKMLLGYFDPDTYQKYLQPVYVFISDNGLVGYVPALQNEFLSR